MNRQNSDLVNMVQLALLLALEVILTFTPLGFILVPPVAITILHIPVIIGGVLMGYGGGAFLGGAFGLLSMLRAATSGNPGDILFNPMASGNPMASILMAVVPRILLGVVAAGVYQLLRKRLKPTLAIGLGAAAACLVHSFGVLSLLWAFFSAFPLREVFLIIISVNGLIELTAGVVVSTAVCRAVMLATKRRR